MILQQSWLIYHSKKYGLKIPNIVNVEEVESN